MEWISSNLQHFYVVDDEEITVIDDVPLLDDSDDLSDISTQFSPAENFVNAPV
jgi:hypothetical protein